MKTFNSRRHSTSNNTPHLIFLAFLRNYRFEFSRNPNSLSNKGSIHRYNKKFPLLLVFPPRWPRYSASLVRCCVLVKKRQVSRKEQGDIEAIGGQERREKEKERREEWPAETERRPPVRYSVIKRNRFHLQRRRKPLPTSFGDGIREYVDDGPVSTIFTTILRIIEETRISWKIS